MRKRLRGFVLLLPLLARLALGCHGSEAPPPLVDWTPQVRAKSCERDADGAVVASVTVGATEKRQTGCSRDTSTGSCEPSDPYADCPQINKDFGPIYGEENGDSDVVSVTTDAKTRGERDAHRLRAVVPDGTSCVLLHVTLDADGSMQTADVSACCDDLVSPDGG